MTFAEDLERQAIEPIEKVIIGEMGWNNYGEEGKEIPKSKKGKVLSWEEARPMLDYDYYTGYGAPDCHAVYAYTKSYVIFVSQYDGATGIESIPRKPVKCDPSMPGGG